MSSDLSLLLPPELWGWFYFLPYIYFQQILKNKKTKKLDALKCHWLRKSAVLPPPPVSDESRAYLPWGGTRGCNHGLGPEPGQLPSPVGCSCPRDVRWRAKNLGLPPRDKSPFGPHPGAILLLTGCSATSEDISGCHDWGLLPALCGQGPGCL